MRDVSEDFKAELGRANYVTPTSYLELITMFQRLVTAKRIENSKTLSRYTVGLDKLQSSAQQVAGMQQELKVAAYSAFLIADLTVLLQRICCSTPYTHCYIPTCIYTSHKQRSTCIVCMLAQGQSVARPLSACVLWTILKQGATTCRTCSHN